MGIGRQSLRAGFHNCLVIITASLRSFVESAVFFALMVQCMSPLLMLWTAPPPARECQRCGCRLRLSRFGEASHANGFDHWSRAALKAIGAIKPSIGCCLIIFFELRFDRSLSCAPRHNPALRDEATL
jgi:hypothetical protein